MSFSTITSAADKNRQLRWPSGHDHRTIRWRRPRRGV